MLFAVWCSLRVVVLVCVSCLMVVVRCCVLFAMCCLLCVVCCVLCVVWCLLYGVVVARLLIVVCC